MVYEATLPRFVARPVRWVFRKFTGRELDGFTWPMPPMIVWLKADPSAELRAHESVHVFQILACYPKTGSWGYRVFVGGIAAMWTWLRLWRQAGYSYFDHPWERQARWIAAGK